MKTSLRSLISQRARLAVWCAALLLAMSSVAAAATLTVINAGDTGVGSLRNAISTAASGDTIVFDPLFFNVARTITIGAASNPMLIQGKNLTIIGPGSGLLTINGGGISRGLESWNIGDAENVFDVVISGMKFTNCNGASARFSGQGGAIENENKMVLTDCVFLSNTCNTAGAAVNSYGANLTCRNCVFDSNTNTGSTGGALLFANDNFVAPGNKVTYIIDQCTFTNNTAAYGACIYIDGSTLTPTTGALVTLTCTNTTFTGNTCNAAFGPVLFTTSSHNASQSLTFRNCTAAGNVYAAGVNASSTGTFYIQGTSSFQNCTISGNQRGGLTLTGDSTGGSAAPAYSVSGCIIFNNSGNDLERNTAIAVPGTLSVTNSLYTSTTVAAINGTNTGNLTASNPALGALGNNGGFVQTMALSGGPAVNVGSNVGGATTDARGYARSVGITDMGAYEFGATTFDFVGVLFPPNNALEVSAATNLVMRFGNASSIVAGTGNIDIKKFSDDSVFESIPVGDARVTISGGTVTINPSGTLAIGTKYYVIIPAGGFKDTGTNSMNAFATNAVWAFTTNGVVAAGPEIAVTETGVGNVADGGAFSFGAAVTGQTVTKTFTVTNSGTANLTLANLTVPPGFSIAANFGSATVTPGNNTTFQITMLTAGPGTPGGTLSFDNNDSDENPYNFTVSGTISKAGTSLSGISDAPDPSVVGQPYTVGFTLNITAPGAGTPTGTVTVTDGTGGTGTATLPATSCLVTSTTQGVKTLTVTYNGDANFNTSTNTAGHLVNKAGTTVANITDAPDPSLQGQAVNVTCVVSATAPGGGTPTGSITVSDGVDNAVGTLVAGSGSASITLNTAGVRTLTVTYSGDANFNGSNNTAGHLVISNQPPVPGAVSAQRYPTQSVKVPVAQIIGAATDPDAGDTISLVSVANGANGTAQIVGNFVLYQPTSFFQATHSFPYTIQDNHGATATGNVTVTVIVDNAPGQNITKITVQGNGSVAVDFAGIPGYTYGLQYTPDLIAPWVTLGPVTTNAVGAGHAVDGPPPVGATSGFYRLVFPYVPPAPP